MDYLEGENIKLSQTQEEIYLENFIIREKLENFAESGRRLETLLANTVNHLAPSLLDMFFDKNLIAKSEDVRKIFREMKHLFNVRPFNRNDRNKNHEEFKYHADSSCFNLNYQYSENIGKQFSDSK